MIININYNNLIMNLYHEGNSLLLDINKTTFRKVVCMGEKVFEIIFDLKEEDINNPQIIVRENKKIVNYKLKEKVGNPYTLFLVANVPGYFIHNKTEAHYTATGFCEFKHPQTREWVRAIMYKRTDIIGDIFVREVSDFLTKFTKK